MSDQKNEPLSFSYSFIKDNKIIQLKIKIHNDEFNSN